MSMDETAKPGSPGSQGPETRFEAIFEQTAIGIALRTPDGVWSRWNQRLYELLGYTPASRPGTLRETTWPPDLAAEQTLNERLERGEIDRYSLETRYLRADGQPLWVQVTASRADADAPETVVSVIEDVSARRQAAAERKLIPPRVGAGAELLEATLRQLPVGVVVADAATGEIILSNNLMSKILQQFPHGPADWPEPMLDEAGRAATSDEFPLSQAPRTGETVRGAEIRWRRSDGVLAILHVNAAPIRGSAGEIVAGVATFDDLTARRQAAARQHFLARASAILADSLTGVNAASLQDLADLTVEWFADVCLIDLIEGDGAVTRIAAGANTAGIAVLATAESLAATWPAGAVRAEAPRAEVVDCELPADTPQPDATTRTPATTDCIRAPLRARGVLLGAVTLAMNESGRQFDAEDRILGDELSRRISTAVDHDRLLAGEQEARLRAERTTGRIARLQELTAALAQAMTPGEVGTIILNVGRAALGASAGLFGVVHTAENRLEIVQTTGYTREMVQPWRDVPLDAPVPLTSVARDGEALFLQSKADTNARFPVLVDVFAPGYDAALIALPVVINDEIVAVLGFSFAESREFSEEARAFARAIAHQSALALERARLYAAEQRARAETEAARARLALLAEASAVIGASLDFEAMPGQLAAMLVPGLADWVMIHLLNDDDEPVLAACAHRDPEQRERVAGLLGAVVVAGPTWQAALGAPASLLGAAASLPDPWRQAGFTSAIVAPLSAHGEHAGAISLMRIDAGGRYVEEERALVADLARRASVAIANGRHFRNAEDARRRAEDATARTSRLQAVTAELAEALSPTEVARALVQQGIAALEADAGSLYVLDDGEAYYRVLEADGYTAGLMQQWETFRASDPIPMAAAVRDRSPLLFSDPGTLARQFPGVTPIVGETIDACASFLVAPLLAGERVIGVLGLSFRATRLFPSKDVDLLTTLVRQSAQALERARLFEAERRARGQAQAAERVARRETTRLAALEQVSRALVEAGPDSNQAVEAVVLTTAELTGDCCVVRLISEDRQWADLIAIHHPDPARLAKFAAAPDFQRMSVVDGLSGEVLQTGEARVMTRGMADAPGWMTEIGVQSVLALPLRARGRQFGELTVLRDQPDQPFTTNDVAFLQELASRAASAIDNGRLYREARDAVRDRDEFLSSAAHELRTPVTMVKGFTQMLRRQQERGDIFPGRASQFITAIDAASERLSLLTDDLVDVSRMRLGKLPMRPRAGDLGEIARRALEHFRERLSPGHQIRLEIAPGSLAVWADPDRVDQILGNLLDNAVKYSPAGGEIVLGIDPEQGGMTLRVTDLGIGLPAAEVESIFEPFNRASNANRDNLPGMGLGLSLCRSIAERHGGRIWAESAGEGHGATIFLWLPSTDPEEQDAPVDA